MNQSQAIAMLNEIKSLAECGMSHGLLADDYCRQIIEKCDEALAATAEVEDGWRLVPPALTREMRRAWDTASKSEDDDLEMQYAYQAMIAAAPTPEASQKGGE